MYLVDTATCARFDLYGLIGTPYLDVRTCIACRWLRRLS